MLVLPERIGVLALLCIEFYNWTGRMAKSSGLEELISVGIIFNLNVDGLILVYFVFCISGGEAANIAIDFDFEWTSYLGLCGLFF